MSRSHFAEGVVHTAVETQRVVANGVIIAGVHVQACAERGGTIGGCTYTALHINARHRGSHIRHVDPENGLALLVIERYVVDSHVDTCVVGTAHAEIGVAYTQTVIARYLQRRHRGEQIRQVLPRVLTIESLVGDNLVVDSGLLNSLRNNLHVLQVIHHNR